MRRAALGMIMVAIGAVPCWANGPEIGFDAGTIFPIESKNIQLVSETVDIYLPGAVVSSLRTPEPNAICKYVLRNLSDSTQTFHMAFVGSAPPMPADTGEVNGLYARSDFEVTQDGAPREVAYYRSRGDEFERFQSHQSLFPTWSL